MTRSRSRIRAHGDNHGRRATEALTGTQGRDGGTSRRRFLSGVSRLAIAGVAPWFMRRTSLGGEGTTAPSDRLRVGMIGLGGMGRHHLDWLLARREFVVTGLCDVDSRHLRDAEAAVNAVAATHAGLAKPLAVSDFRELVEHDEVDAVFVTTPDHWHALVTVMAARAGKDVYCEKPLANSVGESRAIRDVIRDTQRVLQCGSHERSNSKVRFACELVRNGYLGEIRRVEVNLPC
ncbi:MAG TPA: Gfo/Idh/MocA family oxidoreductase, partial [Pirellulaceae bacterium]